MFLFQGIAKSGIHFVPTFRRHNVSIIHVEDLVSAIWEIASRGKSLDAQDLTQGVYHVASNEAPRYSELGRMIGRAVGRKWVVVIPIASPVLKMAAACNEFRSRLSRTPQVLNWDKAREATVGPWLCSNHKVMAELKFRVDKPLQDRLTQTARWYSEQGFFRIRGH
jgi:nucleoside-diphosphate-sugar epimerase